MIELSDPFDIEGVRLDQIATMFHRRLSRAIGTRLRRGGYSLPALSVLAVLWERDGLAQKEIARQAGITTPTCSTAIAGLQRAGLVSSIRSAEDRRRSEIWLTDKGRAARTPINAAVEQVLDGACVDTSPDDLAKACEVIMRIVA
ncbi:MAG TPA: MarR family transcriptional regulator, partial [Arenibaculum sp.]|nr:MarR family transcriptional regulator [Arenibaculum sp.]